MSGDKLPPVKFLNRAALTFQTIFQNCEGLVLYKPPTQPQERNSVVDVIAPLLAHINTTLDCCSGGIVADDWKSIQWHKIEYLITCGLKPWYLDHTDSRQTPAAPPQPTAANMAPEAPHVLSQQQQQQQANQHHAPAGQQQAWTYPGDSTGSNQATVAQQGQPGGGAASGGEVRAVVKVGRPWLSGPGSWQSDVNITIVNKGNFCNITIADTAYTSHISIINTCDICSITIKVIAAICPCQPDLEVKCFIHIQCQCKAL